MPKMWKDPNCVLGFGNRRDLKISLLWSALRYGSMLRHPVAGMCWQREQQTGRSVAEGSSPVRCRFCNRAFPFRSFLLRHERKHTGERPFKCSVCGKSFALKHHLTTHMRTHALHNALQPPGSGTQPTGRTGTLTVEPSLQQQWTSRHSTGYSSTGALSGWGGRSVV